MIYYVTVCKQTIASNLKHGMNKPVIRVSRGKYGKATRVYCFLSMKPRLVRLKVDMKNPLPWGARAWLEVET